MIFFIFLDIKQNKAIITNYKERNKKIKNEIQNQSYSYIQKEKVFLTVLSSSGRPDYKGEFVDKVQGSQIPCYTFNTSIEGTPDTYKATI